MTESKITQKLLVVTSWAPPMVGGPQNFFNLFSQFSPKSYVILTGYRGLYQGGISPSSWLAGEYVFYDRKTSIDRNKQALPTAAVAAESSPSLLYRLVSLFHRLPLFGPIAYSILSLGKTLLMVVAGVKAVRHYRCTSLLGISDHGPALLATGIISLITGKSYQLYLFDIYKGNNFYAIDLLLSGLLEGWLFRRAKQIIVTNEGTEAYYRQRYGEAVKLAVVHNSVFGKDYKQHQAPYNPKPPYTILYTGHAYWAQEQSLLNLIQAMDKLSDLPLQLDLYIPKADKTILEAVTGKENIRLLEAPQAEMPKIQSAATLLFLPLAWYTKSPDIIRTATPGKFTDYLAAGRPILVHAPDYAYISKYGKENNLALVVDEDSVEELAKAIRLFLAHPEKGQKLIDNAQKTFAAHHEATTNAKKMSTLLGL